jgi:hypothetical protein
MNDNLFHPSPGDLPEHEQRLAWIQAFWEQLDIDGSGDLAETTWEALDGLRAEVAKALAKVPRDINRAESLTAYAALLITGQLLV